jgi:DNA-cytosine methyltransferase
MMNILSLFDGMSCGQIAINRLGIKYDNYFASEIDKYAMQVTKANYPDTKHIGSVVDVKGENLPKIDLLIGGSPCQSFSFAGKRKGMSTACNQEILTLEHYLELKADGFEFEGQSYLFWEYMRLLKETKPKYFLLENVMMSAKWQKILSQAIGIDPIMINSSLLSAQNRKRLYWTNIGTNTANLFGIDQPGIMQPKDKGILLRDILEDKVEDRYFLSDKAIERTLRYKGAINSLNTDYKALCLAADYYKGGRDNQYVKTDRKGNLKKNQDKSSTLSVGGHGCGNHSDMDCLVIKCHSLQPRCGDPKKGGTGPLSREDGKTYCLDTGCSMAIETNKIRRLTPIECERLQTVPDNYTNHVSNCQRYKMLGNGWTVDVIAYIFKHMEL